MKKRFELKPPVEKMKRSRTEFSKKKLAVPPKLNFFLLFMEIRRNMKTKNPIAGTVRIES